MQSRAQPSGRRLAGVLLEYLETLPDRFLLVIEQVHGYLCIAMAHERPAGIAHRSGNRLSGALTDPRIDRGAGLQIALRQCIHEPPDSHTHSVLVPGPIRDIGHRGHTRWRADVFARHRLFDIPFLDVDHGVNGDPCSAW